MPITISFPPATEAKLQAEAAATGKDVETFVKEAVETKLALSKLSLKDVLAPLQDAVEASGLSPAQADALFESELEAVRDERRASRSGR